jgi:ribosomal protein S18 acetylase RimI-like enzyme
MHVRPFHPNDTEPVVKLWQACELLRPWNDPRKDIARKLRVQSELFLVGERDATIVATAMAGYEGHRGWVSYLAVDPEFRDAGLGRQMMLEVERMLAARGCPKINLQVRGTNTAALAFYERLGYAIDDAISLGKRLERDD